MADSSTYSMKNRAGVTTGRAVRPVMALNPAALLEETERQLQRIKELESELDISKAIVVSLKMMRNEKDKLLEDVKLELEAARRAIVTPIVKEETSFIGLIKQIFKR